MVLSDRWLVSDEQIIGVVEALQSGQPDSLARHKDLQVGYKEGDKYRIGTRHCPQLGQPPKQESSLDKPEKPANQCRIGNAVNLAELEKHETIQCSQSGKRIRGAVSNEIRVYVYIQSTQDTLAMWVSPDLSIGGETAPENRETSGQLAPSTAGSRRCSKNASRCASKNASAMEVSGRQSKDASLAGSRFLSKESPDAESSSKLMSKSFPLDAFRRPSSKEGSRRPSREPLEASRHSSSKEISIGDLPDIETSSKDPLKESTQKASTQMDFPRKASTEMGVTLDGVIPRRPGKDCDSIPEMEGSGRPSKDSDSIPEKGSSRRSSGRDLRKANSLLLPNELAELEGSQGLSPLSETDPNQVTRPKEDPVPVLEERSLGFSDVGLQLKDWQAEQRKKQILKQLLGEGQAIPPKSRKGSKDSRNSSKVAGYADSDSNAASSSKSSKWNVSNTEEKPVNLQEMIAKMTGIPAKSQRLFYGTRALSTGDPLTLRQQCVNHGAKITLCTEGVDGARATALTMLREASKHNKSSTGAWVMPRWENPKEKNSYDSGASGLYASVHVHNYQGLRDVGFIDPCGSIRSNFGFSTGRQGSKSAR